MRTLLTMLLLLAVNTPRFCRAVDPPPAALKLIEEFKAKEKAAQDALDAEIAALRAKARKQTEEHKQGLVARLEAIRAQLEREKKHNEARAVAARIRTILTPPIQAQPGPANLTALAANAANFDKPLIFRVTGRLEGGSVWGVDLYTSDSDLAKAAVHAGVLAPGETGLVKVTLVSTAGVDFAGSERNGVSTSSYTEWPTGYRVERVTAEEQEGVIEAEDPPEPAAAPPEGVDRSPRSRAGVGRRFSLDIF